MEQWERLYAEAERLLSTHPDAEQAVVLLTEQGGLRALANHGITEGDTADEARFLSTLRSSGDAVTRLLVLWRGSYLDVPSMHFRQGLMDLSPTNGAALVLLRGEGHLNVRKLETLF